MSKLKILVGVPSTGQIKDANVSWLVSHQYEVVRLPSSKSGPNFNSLWQAALNQARRGEITHFAMVHADIEAVCVDYEFRWGDVLAVELGKFDADFISVPSAIKDQRGLTACGIGNPDNRWTPFRRFTTIEIEKLPKTFGIEDTEHPDKYLLHNHALCMWDMRKPLWQTPASDGSCRFVFNFQERMDLVDGVWELGVESEDWAYSRQLWQAKAKTLITRRITIIHQGSIPFPSVGDWGSYKNGDEDTASQWRKGVLCG